MKPALSGQGIVVDAGNTRIVNGIDIDLFAGEMLALVGPNGAGKSTLLKALAGDIPLTDGTITLNGKAICAWTAEERARQRAVLPQSPDLAFAFRGWDVVELGRHPHMRTATRRQDEDAIRGAMGACDVLAFASRECATLSGGEAHRTHFARAMAQIWSGDGSERERVLLLDEPTSSLDLFHQHAILNRARKFARSGSAILVVLHDLNLAATYADRIAVLTQGTIDITAAPQDALTTSRISRIWGVNCRISQDAHTGRPQMTVVPEPDEQPHARIMGVSGA